MQDEKSYLLLDIYNAAGVIKIRRLADFVVSGTDIVTR